MHMCNTVIHRQPECVFAVYHHIVDFFAHQSAEKINLRNKFTVWVDDHNASVKRTE